MGTEGGFRMQKHCRELYYGHGQRRRIQEAGAQQEGVVQIGHRRMFQEAEAQQEGVLQTREQEEDSGGKSTGGVLQTRAQEEDSGGSTTDKGTGGGLRRQQHSWKEYYRQGHRRRIPEAGAQQEGVLQTREEEEDSGGKSTAGRSTTDKGTREGFRRQEHSKREYYRQGHRRRIKQAGAQQEGVPQTTPQE
ncbi:hypothetical protein NDU88_011892 [Pleurodeles waltl]|uniref:Uncharacterized protein n=1 Tax=Pleurodeles waltl TaxID=8319 RepID=A0AAV7S2K4_PLEWA|nr:hypothetical protein NDU88_011892 [Pleurodeles waltl]